MEVTLSEWAAAALISKELVHIRAHLEEMVMLDRWMEVDVI